MYEKLQCYLVVVVRGLERLGANLLVDFAFEDNVGLICFEIIIFWQELLLNLNAMKLKNLDG